MNEPFLEQYRPFLIGELNKLRALPEEQREAGYYEAQIYLIEKQLIFIDGYLKSTKENTDMKNIKIEFGELIDISELPKKMSENTIKGLIMKQAPSIPKGKAQIVKVSSGKWHTVSNAVQALQKNGQLGKNYRAAKRGETIFLIHE